MAYVPGVKNDLFISYAHVDNEQDSHNTRWVSEFVRGFTVELRQRLGGPKDFSLFFDESDLHAHHHLQILLENARQSAIFLAVLSPSYVSHDWTMKELVAFAGIASDSRRIIVVEKLPLEIGDSYPAEIEQHKRTQFWRTNEPESHTPSTLTAYGRSAEYRQRLENLADQVQRLMREMRRAAQEPATVAPPPAPAPTATPRPEPVALTKQPDASPKEHKTEREDERQKQREPAAPPPMAPTHSGKATPKTDSDTPPSLIDAIWPEGTPNRVAKIAALVIVAGSIIPAFLVAAIHSLRSPPSAENTIFFSGFR